MGHELATPTLRLMREVQQRFPQKVFLIHPIDVVEHEAGVLLRQERPRKAMTDFAFTDYIAIWIDHRMMTAEFNAVLCEELYHNVQASEGWPAIVGMGGAPQAALDANVAILIDFKDLLRNALWDVGNHRALVRQGIDISPLLDDQLLRVTQGVNSLTPEIIRSHRTNLTYVTFFGQYLVNSLDFALPEAAPYGDRWLPAKRVLQSLPPPQVLEAWERIERDLIANPIDDAAAYRRAASMITREILYHEPGLTLHFDKTPTTGKTLNLKVGPLVPPDPP